MIKLLNTVRTPVSIKIGGIAHHGYFEVENGLIRVSYRGSTKATQIGGSPPEGAGAADPRRAGSGSPR
jgi:hypothetical protein